MVTILLLAAVMLQQQLAVIAEVDRQEVQVGEELVLTITVEAPGGSAPVEIGDPDLFGLELLSARDQTRVSVEGPVPARITTRRLTLRALRPGIGTIGRVRVRQGEETAETAPIRITVSAPTTAAPTALDPRIERMVEAAPAPDVVPDEVSLAVVTSPDSVVLGQQVDVVVVAWFPRDIRARLRNPPTLEPPLIRGAWTYDRPAPLGIVTSRRVRGVWYDLFALHRVVFPLTAGVMEIGSATVSYSVPVSSSFLSRELRHEVQSEPRAVRVAALPRPRGVRGYAGAAGGGLLFQVDAPPGELRLGDAAQVRAVLTGQGNVALWPEPEFDWPVGLRAYPQEVTVSIAAEYGLVGGSKVFDYLVVADSAGTHRVPATSYAYFDIDTDRYVQLRAPALEFVTPSGLAGITPVQTVRPLLTPGGLSLDAWLTRVSLWVWIVIGVAPPLAAVALRTRTRWLRRLRRPRRAPRLVETLTLRTLELEFRDILEGFVPQTRLRVSDGLADALRAAGVEDSLATHAARVRDRLRQALYGPEGSTDPEELTAEVQEVLRALRGGTGKVRTALAALALALAVLVSAGPADGQSPARLYDAGAVRPAADSFATRARATPHAAAHWYNLGAALDRLGEDVRARAAWLRAARLTPRDETVRRALQTGAPPDAPPGGLTFVAPVTPGEALAAAAGLWVLGWVLLALRTPVRRAVPVLVLAALVAGYGAAFASRYARPVALVMLDGTALRAAPYGPAPSERELGAGTGVLIQREHGAWVLVSDGVVQGWLLRTEVVPL
jgi:hypothetical protein